MICLKPNRLRSGAIHVLYNQSEYRRKEKVVQYDTSVARTTMAKRGDVSRGFTQGFFILGESERIMIICGLSLFLSTASKSKK